MSKKIAFFPVDRSTVSVVRFADTLLHEVVVPLLSPSLGNFANKDIATMDGGTETGVQFSINYEQEIFLSQKVFFCNSDLIKDNEIYFKLIEYARSLNKEVVISKYLENRLGINMELDRDEIKSDYQSEELLEIEIPIISIFTYGNYCNQLNIELSTRNYFLNHNYRVTQIGSNIASEYFEYASIPEFLYDESIGVEERIIRFNRFVYRLSKKENADVIILGVPDSIMKYNNQILNGLGVIPFIIQSAIHSDVAIVSLYQNNYPEEYYEEVQKYCKYRYGVTPKYFNIANTRIIKNVDDNTVMDYVFLDASYVTNNIDRALNIEDCTIFSCMNNDECNMVCSKIENELSENIYRL